MYWPLLEIGERDITHIDFRNSRGYQLSSLIILIIIELYCATERTGGKVDKESLTV